MSRTPTTLLEALVKGSLALVVSALILLAVYTVYAQRNQREAAVPAQPLVIPGSSLQAVVGTAQVAGDALNITGYEPRNGELVAVAAWRGRLAAGDYPLLKFQVDTDFPGPALEFVWYTQDKPGVLMSADMSATGGDESWLDLSRHPHWRGSVVDLGIYARTGDARAALSISGLTLEPRSWRGSLASYWSALTAYRGWTARTINQIYGSVDTAVLSPVLVAAAWSGLAVMLLLVAGIFSRLQAGALFAAVLLPWIALDLLWQKELMTQLSQTRDQFAGKTVVEKHLADVDRHIYRYIMRLKQDVLPEQHSRILILHDSYTHEFTRLKAQYYLLPHNVYNFGGIPPEHGLDTVDYVLVLGTVPRLNYDAIDQALVWRKRGKRSLPVELLDEDVMGRLYRVQRRASDSGEAI